MQATSDKTASANFTQTGHTISEDRDVTTSITNGKTGYAPYYQWGRKDAFRSAQYTTSPAAGTDVIFSATAVTVGKTIQNPTTFYANNYNPYTPVYNNDWNSTYTELAGNATDNIVGLNKTVKAVYDPSPVGYTVSPGNMFPVFTAANMPVDGNGRAYTINGKKLYFPFCYMRNYNDGDRYTSSTYGQYWSAVNGSSAVGRRMLIGPTEVRAVDANQFAYRSWGSSVRPVREK